MAVQLENDLNLVVFFFFFLLGKVFPVEVVSLCIESSPMHFVRFQGVEEMCRFLW